MPRALLPLEASSKNPQRILPTNAELIVSMLTTSGRVKQ